MNINELLRLQWTWHGPALVQEAGSDPHFELRVRELPEFFVAGRTREEVLVASGPALYAFLLSYVDHQEVPPLPANRRPAWVPQKVNMPPQLAIPTARDPQEMTLTY